MRDNIRKIMNIINQFLGPLSNVVTIYPLIICFFKFIAKFFISDDKRILSVNFILFLVAFALLIIYLFKLSIVVRRKKIKLIVFLIIKIICFIILLWFLLYSMLEQHQLIFAEKETYTADITTNDVDLNKLGNAISSALNSAQNPNNVAIPETNDIANVLNQLEFNTLDVYFEDISQQYYRDIYVNRFNKKLISPYLNKNILSEALSTINLEVYANSNEFNGNYTQIKDSIRKHFDNNNISSLWLIGRASFDCICNIFDCRMETICLDDVLLLSSISIVGYESSHAMGKHEEYEIAYNLAEVFNKLTLIETLEPTFRMRLLITASIYYKISFNSNTSNAEKKYEAYAWYAVTLHRIYNTSANKDISIIRESNKYYSLSLEYGLFSNNSMISSVLTKGLQDTNEILNIN